MPKITITTRLTARQVRKALAALPRVMAGQAPDLTGEARRTQLAVGTAAMSLIRQAFVEKARGGADESGMSWAPLAPATAARRRKAGGTGSPEILRDTGLLLNSLSPGVHTLQARPGQVVVGTNDPKAAWHHFGTTTIPARPLWPPPERWPARWLAAIAGVMRQGLLRLLAKTIGGS